MKKQFLRAICLIIFTVPFQNCFAQYWNDNGNSGTNPSTNFLGTIDATDLVLRTNNTEKLRLKSGGNLGLGITAPNYLLHLHTATTGTEVFEQFTNGTTNSTSTDGFRVGVNSSNNAELRMYESAPMTFFTTSLERMRITAGGDVGIGITAPARRLDVASAGYQLRLTYSTNGSVTDLGTNGYGQLIIDPGGSTPAVGINQSTNALFATLDVNGTAALRVVDQDNSLTKILVWNSAGNKEIKWKDGTNMLTTCGGSIAGYYSLFSSATTACTGHIFDDGANIGVGISSGILGKLHVVQTDVNSKSIYATNTGNSSYTMYATNTGSSSYLFYGTNTGSASIGADITAKGYGVHSVANGEGIGGLFGVYGVAIGSSNTGTTANTPGSIGVHGFINTNTQSSCTNIGVKGLSEVAKGATTTKTNVGVWGEANGGDSNTGVYGVTVGTGANDWAGYFSGPVTITGNGFVNGTTQILSDENLKTDIQDINDADDVLSKLHPVKYFFGNDAYAYMHLPQEQQSGLLAQEAKLILPQIVKDEMIPAVLDSNGNVIKEAFNAETVNYNALIAYLIRGYQELKAKQDECCNGGMRLQDQGSNPSQTIKIVSESIAQLGDCVPNPTSGNTIITVRVPEKISEALIILTDQLGNEVFREAITNRGYSDLNIETSQMENGIYHYSLITDGQLIGTKQLVKQH